MKVFITGATGVLGRVVARLLLDGGYQVRALARSARNESQLREIGAEPFTANLFDSSSLRKALMGRDAVLHLATHIPPAKDATRPGAWRENDRIRREGTRNLVDSDIECGVTTFIYPGIVLVYPDGGANWLDAATAPAPSSSLPFLLDA